MPKVLVIMGSSRSDGETAKSVDVLIKGQDAEVIDLLKYDIGFFDYDHKNTNDAFFDISKKMFAADKIVLATPVYWYAMSALLKMFFDRLSDLITVRKSDGRLLAGKHVYVLANGTDKDLPEGFDVPFKRTADYFDMNYVKLKYLYTGDDKEFLSSSWNTFLSFQKEIFKAEKGEK